VKARKLKEQKIDKPSVFGTANFKGVASFLGIVHAMVTQNEGNAKSY
jgi:hypothetical protein